MSTLRLVTSTDASNPNWHDLYLDDSGQLEIIGTDITDTDDYARSVAQSITCRLLMIKGEWYQDQRIGTPWREKIWVKNVAEQTVYRLVSDVVMGTPGVRTVESMDIDIDGTSRTLTVSDLKVIAETGLIVTVDQIDIPMIIPVLEEAL